MKTEHKKIIESSGSDLTSQNAVELLRDIEAAELALANANCEELFALFKKAIKERGDAMRMMLQVSQHFMGDKTDPFYQPSDAIESMERVSLAAIQLARDVAVTK